MSYYSYAKRQTGTGAQAIASKSAKKAYAQTFSQISPDTEMLIDQVLNPEDCNEITRWPNTYGLSAVYKCKTVFNAKFAEDSRSCVAVAPTIKDSIFTTAGEVTNQQLRDFGVATSPLQHNPYSFQGIVLDSMNEQVPMSSPILFANGHAISPFPNAQYRNLMYPLSFANDGGGSAPTILVIFQMALSFQAVVTCAFFDSGKVQIGSTTQNIAVLPGIGYSGVSVPIKFYSADPTQVAYIAITYQGVGIPYKGPVTTAIVNTAYDGTAPNNIDIVMPNHAQHFLVHDIKDAGTIASTASQAFVLAQSLLLTAEMSDINNGGMLSIARIPGRNAIGMDGDSSLNSITSNSWYEWIASLANNNHDGPVKEGGYAFYLPEDETGFFYRSPDNYFSKELPYIAAEFTCTEDLTESAVVRIKVSTIVQFTTTASIYDQRPSSHINDLELIHHLLSLIPAAYTNEGHKRQIKALLNKIGGRLKAMLKDPKTYVTAGQLISKLAPMALAAL